MDLFSTEGGYGYAYLVVRIILGILFFFQGYDKVFRIGLANTALHVKEEYKERSLPLWFIHFSVWISSLIELLCGLLLVVGLFQDIALFLLGLHFIMLALAFSYLQPIWDMRHYATRLALFLFLLLIPGRDAALSIDLYLHH